MNKMSDMFNITRDSMNFSKLSSLYDTLSVDQYLGRPLPKDLSDDDLKNMDHLHSWFFALRHTYNLSRAENAGKLQRILDTFDSRTKVPDSYPLKWVFLSAHDTDIVPMQVDLNITSSICIEELYRTGSTSAINC